MDETEEIEAGFPPIPPPPPMTPAQYKQAEASIQAAIAREAERKARLLEELQIAHNAEHPAFLMAAIMQPCECLVEEEQVNEHEDASSRSMRKRRSAAPRRKAEKLLSFEMPENKPRKPNLHAANLSFAARVIIWVRDRYANNAPAIYKAAYLSRKTYSAIISDENHVVSKRTAIQLAFALRLTREEADLLLHAAGYHLSRSVVEDMIFDACLEANIYNLEDVNHFLIAHECRPFIPQT